jgi:hypothetical protein
MMDGVGWFVQGGLVSSREEIDAALQTFSTPSGNPDDEDRMSVVYTNCAGFLRVCNKYFLRDHRDIIGTWRSRPLRAKPSHSPLAPGAGITN